MNIQTDPTQISSYFVRNTRPDGSSFVTLSDDRPEWLQTAVYEAHDGETPNDWRYQTAAHIVELLADYDLADIDDYRDELADSLVDIYTHDLLAWLAADLNRTGYCDEAWNDDLASASDDGIVGLIRLGQYVAITAMVDILAAAIADNADQS